MERISMPQSFSRLCHCFVKLNLQFQKAVGCNSPRKSIFQYRALGSKPYNTNQVSARWKDSFISRNLCMEKHGVKYCMRSFSSDSQNSRPPPKKMPFWQRLLFVSGVAGVIYYIFKDAIHKKEIESEQTRYQELGKAQLGGDWTLTDHHGNRRSSTEFRGRWILLYFGFTHCPDICPEELEKLIEIVKMFEKEPSQPNIQPLFISLDPERDSPKVIKDYCAEYSPQLLGFTGPEDELREVCKKFRVYFGKGERDENNDYIVDHTIIIYLINPRGEFVNYFGRSLTADAVYKSVSQHIARYNELELAGKLEGNSQHLQQK